MPKTRQQKSDQIEKLTQKFTDAGSVVFTDYKGMTMTQLSELRKSLRDNSAEFSVTKNNLVRLALKNASISVDDALLDGPTATLFSFGDEIAPIKILTKALKDNNIGEVKAGLLNGEVMDKYKVQKLASLPSKDELRGKTVGVLVAPLHGIVGVLQANLRNLVYALDQIKVSKGGE
jgi:large subunit ribosomal protein L10